MELTKEIRGLVALSAVLAVGLGGCAIGERKSPMDTPGLVACSTLDALMAKPGVTRDEIVQLPGNVNNSCRESDGSVRENVGGIG